MPGRHGARGPLTAAGVNLGLAASTWDAGVNYLSAKWRRVLIGAFLAAGGQQAIAYALEEEGT